MRETWKKHDRPCSPCPNCGTELYEAFWGNGGWAKTEKGTEDHIHSDRDCIRVLKAVLAELNSSRESSVKPVRVGSAVLYQGKEATVESFSGDHNDRES